jgi:hypothetical protein
MNSDICFTCENAEYRSTLYMQTSSGWKLCRVFYVVGDLQEGGDESFRVTLRPTQVVNLEDGQSPDGCNSCDLGDDGLSHSDRCSIHHVGLMHIIAIGEVSYAP